MSVTSFKDIPAFPGGSWPPNRHIPTNGMTLRDYFAGQALKGLCTQLPDDLMFDLAEGTRGGKYIVGASYALADAMLKARESNNG